MLFKYGTVNEVYKSASRFPGAVATELLTCAVILDAEYGEDRDYEESGGYSIVIESSHDLDELRSIINYDTYLCEWATRLGRSGFISALYIMNNDFSLMVFMPESIAPTAITSELE